MSRRQSQTYINAHAEKILLLLSERRAGLSTLAKRLPRYARSIHAQQLDLLIGRGLVKNRGNCFEITAEGAASVTPVVRSVDRLPDLHGHWRPPAVVRRAGSLDFVRHPSRMGDDRVYRPDREKYLT